MDFCVHWGCYKTPILFHCMTFETLYEWYNLWEELQQLQPYGQQYMQLKTDDQLIQTSPPNKEYITEIRQQ